MGVRVAMNERIPRAYIDREVTAFHSSPYISPDPYALKTDLFGRLCINHDPFFVAPPT